MTAETIHTEQPTYEPPLVEQRPAPILEMVPDMQLTLLPIEQVEPASSRAIKHAAEQIVRGFLSIPAELSTDQRDQRKEILRANATHFLFKSLKIAPNTAAFNDEFTKLYAAAETEATEMDRSTLGDLTDRYFDPDHPFVAAVDLLESDSRIHTDIVKIRRTGMLLLDRLTAKN